MPTYRVDTSQGAFEVELDRAPSSAQELHDTVAAKLGASRVPQPVAAGTAPEPEAGGGVQFLKQAGLPFLGGLGGALAGGAVGGPVGSILGESLGSAGGAGLNNLFGITQGGAGEVATAAALPPVARGLLGMARLGRNFAPGTRTTAENMNNIAVGESERLLAGLRPSGPSASQLFQAARNQNVTLPAGNTTAAADAAINELGTLSQGAQDLHRPALKYLQGLKEKIQSQGGVLNPDELQNELAALGDITATLARGGKPGTRFLAKVRDGLLDDLDTAAATANPAQPAAQTLQAARQTFLREKTTDEVGQIFDKATVVKQGQGDAVQFNAAQAIRDLQKNRFYEKAYTPEVRAEIEGVLKMLNTYPALPAGAGANYGFGRLASGLSMLGGAGLGAGYASGSVGTGIAAAGGLYGAGIMRNVWTAMQTPGGRALVAKLVAGGKGELTPQAAGLLGAAVGGGLMTPGGAQ